jgi:hypothetical protein
MLEPEEMANVDDVVEVVTRYAEVLVWKERYSFWYADELLMYDRGRGLKILGMDAVRTC